MTYLMITLKWSQLGQQYRSPFYFAGGDAVIDNAQAIGDRMRTDFVDDIDQLFHDGLSLWGFDARSLDSSSLPSIPYTFTAGVAAGSGGVVPLPTQTAALVTWKASVAPPNKTRKYLSGLVIGAMSGGYFTATTVNALGAWAQDVLDLGANLTLGIGLATVQWSGDHTYVTGANIMTHYSVSNIPSTQRRRKIGVGI